MTAIFAVIIGGLTLFSTGRFALMTLKRSGSFSVKTRIGMITALADTVLALALAHLFIPWSTVPTALWMLPVGLAAAGVAGAVLRWSSLPGVDPDRSARRQFVSGSIHVVIVAAVVVLIVLF